MSYVIKHKKRGIYIEHEMAPRFTKKKKDRVKKFASESEAEGIITLFDMKGCTVEPLKKDGSR